MNEIERVKDRYRKRENDRKMRERKSIHEVKDEESGETRIQNN